MAFRRRKERCQRLLYVFLDTSPISVPTHYALIDSPLTLIEVVQLCHDCSWPAFMPGSSLSLEMSLEPLLWHQPWSGFQEFGEVQEEGETAFQLQGIGPWGEPKIVFKVKSSSLITNSSNEPSIQRHQKEKELMSDGKEPQIRVER